MEYPNKLLTLINCFRKLPGVGAKSAERMAFQVLNMNPETIDEFSEAVKGIQDIKHCKVCGNFSEDDVCEICSSRDDSTICVVHSPKDVITFEKMKEYNGVYHVLNGYINPNKNISSNDINLNSLLERVDKNKTKEVILATDLTVEGEITAMYISKLLERKEVKVTRLAHGLPNGAELDYADELTLFKAFSNRKEVK